MIELPNTDWIRSPKMPNYAVCLDRNNRFFGWKMIENEAYGAWTSVAKLTPDELLKAGRSPEFASHLKQLSELVSMTPATGQAVKQFWLAEVNQHGNPTLIDGPHSDSDGAEEALTLRKRLRTSNMDGRGFAVAEVILREPTGRHRPLNEDAISVITTAATNTGQAAGPDR